MKSLFASRTAWVGAITLGIGLANLLAGSELIAQWPTVTAGAISAAGALGIILRLLTTKPIK